MIEVLGLTKSYSRHGTPAVSDVSLTVGKGEILGFVGLNGAGKTTTIKTGAGVLLPSSGTVVIDGRDIVREKREASAMLGSRGHALCIDHVLPGPGTNRFAAADIALIMLTLLPGVAAFVFAYFLNPEQLTSLAAILLAGNLQYSLVTPAAYGVSWLTTGLASVAWCVIPFLLFTILSMRRD